MTDVRFFRSGAEFGRWLATYHARESELWVGLYKKHAAHRGMTYLQAVDEALCWGWIDGMMRRIDDDRVMQRFTPRRPRSTWSRINVAKVRVLMKAGRMRPPGLARYQARDPERTGIYSFEGRAATFTPAQQRAFKKASGAWKWFMAQAPSYRRTATHWVASAKREATRERRLTALISHSAEGRSLPQFSPSTGRGR